MRFAGKSVVVTGASRGIGLAITRAIIDEGGSVVMVARDESRLEAVASTQENCAFVAGNVGDALTARAAADLCLERFGSVDALVNNAATNPYFGPLMEIDEARALKIVEVNQLAPLLWVQECYRRAMKDHGGVVLNVASTGGFAVESGISFYNTSKAALIHLTRHLAAELGPAIRVNAIAPGLVRTDMAKALWEEHEDRVAMSYPLGRIGEPVDIASAAAFLLSEDASWMTGHTMVVDGGELVRYVD